MYGFMILDGTVTARDVAHMIEGMEKGFCVDVNRAFADQFNYSSLEALKNGVIVSQKYAEKLWSFTQCQQLCSAIASPTWRDSLLTG